MKHILTIFLLVSLAGKLSAQQSDTLNYIISRTYKNAGANVDDVSKVVTQITYIDGLGRSFQNVTVGQSPAGSDLVQPMAYDGANRQPIQYLPYVAGGDAASCRPKAIADAAAWYTGNSALLQAASPVTLDLARPFTQTTFEPSPLSRTSNLQQPGTRSRPNTIKYKVNTASEIKRYDYIPASDTLNFIGNYAAGDLRRTVYIDEQNQESNEYTDQLGLVICKTVLTGTETLYTYYIYDDLGLLRAVLQPQYQDDNSFYHSAFRYYYDDQGRMIKKRIPGGFITEFVYDKYDRQAYSRTGEQKTRNVWGFTKYDELNRPVVTGEISSTATQNDLTGSVNTSAHHENRNDGAVAGYTLNLTAPTSATESNLLTITFYDDYTFSKPAGFGYTTSTGFPTSANTAVKSLVTGSRAKKLPGVGSSTEWLTTVNYYDAEYRPIQTVRELYDMGTDANERVSTKYRYDLASVVEQQQTVQLVGGVLHTHTAENTYDHADRLLGVKETVKIGTKSKSAYTLAQRYNTLGQLQTKWLHAYDYNAGAYRTRTNYTHNILGWLTDAKTWYQYNLGTDRNYYTIALSYENKGDAQKYSNGNISKMEWSIKDLGTMSRGLAFTYDNANRLLSALKPATTTYAYADTESGITYYKNGNIHELKRGGGGY